MAQWMPRVVRRRAAIAEADVVHVHYATSVPLLTQRGMPRRPYVLHLHGTDIREQWAAPATHGLIQDAIDGARHVYYANLDTAEQARAARSDAEFLPQPIEVDGLPPWRPGSEGGRPTVVFTSRWDDVKGAPANIELAQYLHAALGPETVLVGLDWGQRAPAARAAGVRLVPVMDIGGFHALLASADVAVGQARPVLAGSEWEAMGIGVPLAALGSRIPRPEDGTTPPVLEGSLQAVVEAVRIAMLDPRGTSERLDGARWVRQHHAAGPLIAPLLEAYRAARL